MLLASSRSPVNPLTRACAIPLSLVRRILNEAVSVVSRDFAPSVSAAVRGKTDSHRIWVPTCSAHSHSQVTAQTPPPPPCLSPSFSCLPPCMREFLSLGYRDTACFPGVGFKGETAQKSWKFARSLKGTRSFMPFNLSMHWHGVLDHVQFRVWLRRRRYRIIA